MLVEDLKSVWLCVHNQSIRPTSDFIYCCNVRIWLNLTLTFNFLFFNVFWVVGLAQHLSTSKQYFFCPLLFYLGLFEEGFVKSEFKKINPAFNNNCIANFRLVKMYNFDLHNSNFLCQTCSWLYDNVIPSRCLYQLSFS